MRKQIRLTESQLRSVIREAIVQELREESFPLGKLPYELAMEVKGMNSEEMIDVAKAKYINAWELDMQYGNTTNEKAKSAIDKLYNDANALYSYAMMLKSNQFEPAYA